MSAFKLTSEAQTIYEHLLSPGEVDLARIDRDLRVFDLGAEVYEKIKAQGPGNNRQFVADILRQRARRFAGHPEKSPEKLLGNVSLEQIAIDIAKSTTSAERKEIYRGLSALAGVCVGDIGDVINLYERILEAWKKDSIPIPARVQSECFQDFCARRLYDLNRRRGVLMAMAKSFAEASYELLVRSAAPENNEDESETVRIRQYSAVYVRVTSGDKNKQLKRLRELVDAGVFVFTGRSAVPRSKTQHANPTQQFKLMYRKIYGVVNFIGLADRDRFEVSGADLEEWIDDPTKGKEILLRNLGGEDETRVTNETARPDDAAVVVASDSAGTRQALLFGTLSGSAGRRIGPEADEAERERDAYVSARKPVVREMAEDEVAAKGIDAVVVGLGFEERAEESIRRILATVRPRTALTVSYAEIGRRSAIEALLRGAGISWVETNYEKAIDSGLPTVEGAAVVDVTGLSKPMIFYAVRNELRRKGCVMVCHTEAEDYYPRSPDLVKILEAWERKGSHGLLEELPGVLTGEHGPYTVRRLLRSDADETRRRTLFAFASAKHERLMSLVDYRDYDRLEIIAPDGCTPRSKVARLVAEMVARNHRTAMVERVGSNDLDGVLRRLGEKYKTLYVDSRLNLEVGLTGSKLQAVACAAASAAFKLSQSWYLEPQRFDTNRFTVGVGRTRWYEIRLEGGRIGKDGTEGHAT